MFSILTKFYVLTLGEIDKKMTHGLAEFEELKKVFEFSNEYKKFYGLSKEFNKFIDSNS